MPIVEKETQELIKPPSLAETTPHWAARNSSAEREKTLSALKLNGLPRRVTAQYKELLSLAGETVPNELPAIRQLARRYIAEAYSSPSLPATRGLENDQLGPKTIGSRRLLLENAAGQVEKLALQIGSDRLNDEEIIQSLEKFRFVFADLCNTYGINNYSPELADHQIKRMALWLNGLGAQSTVCREGDEFFAVVIFEPNGMRFNDHFTSTYQELIKAPIKYKDRPNDETVYEGSSLVRAGSVDLLTILKERLDGIDEIISMNQELTPQQKIFALVGLAIDEVEKRMRQMERESLLLIAPDQGELTAEQIARIKELAVAIITQPEKKIAAPKRASETLIPQELLEEIDSASSCSKTVREILIGLAEKACLDPLFSDLQIPVLTRFPFIRLAEQANQNKPIALVQINLELIKEMNDQDGHAAVDRVLRATGEILYRNAADYGFKPYPHRQGIKFWLALSDANGGLCQERIDEFIVLIERRLAGIKSLLTGGDEDLRFASTNMILEPNNQADIGPVMNQLYSKTKEEERRRYREYLRTEPSRAQRIKKERPATIAEWTKMS